MDKTIYVFEIAGITPSSCLAAIDDYSSFSFSKRFQGAGNFTLKGIYTDAIKDVFAVGRMIWATDAIAGIIQSVDIICGDDGSQTYTVYGQELSQVLSYRIVWDTYSRNLPANRWVEGLVSSNTQGVRQLFQSQEVSSFNAPNLDKQVSYTNLLETLEEVCEATRTSKGLLMGFDVTCPNAEGFTFKVIEGKDRTYESPEPFLVNRAFDNVSHLTLTTSEKDMANVVKAGGEGEGSSRKFQTAGDLTLSGFERRESFRDCRNLQSKFTNADGTQSELTEAQYAALLKQEAAGALKPETFVIDADCIVSQEEAFDLLGSKITFVDTAFGVRVDDYVYEVNLIWEGLDNFITITVGSGLQVSRLKL